jgi:hypothetical protein
MLRIDQAEVERHLAWDGTNPNWRPVEIDDA